MKHVVSIRCADRYKRVETRLRVCSHASSSVRLQCKQHADVYFFLPRENDQSVNVCIKCPLVINIDIDQYRATALAWLKTPKVLHGVLFIKSCANLHVLQISSKTTSEQQLLMNHTRLINCPFKNMLCNSLDSCFLL